MESLDQLKQKKEAFYKTCRNLIILNHNSYSLKIKIQDETPDHDTNKVIPGKLSRNCLRQEKNLVEKYERHHLYICMQRGRSYSGARRHFKRYVTALISKCITALSGSS